MKKFAVLLAVFLWTSFQVVAGENSSFGIGPKIWYAKIKDIGSGPLYGITANLDIQADWWISGYGCFGRVPDDDYDDLDFDVANAEFVIGKSETLFNWGFGLRYTQFAISIPHDSEEVSNTGPLIYIGTGQLFGESMLGWYAGGSLGYGFGDDAEGEFISYEVGLYASLSRWLINVGYRGWGGFDALDSFTGPAVSATYNL